VGRSGSGLGKGRAASSFRGGIDGYLGGLLGLRFGHGAQVAGGLFLSASFDAAAGWMWAGAIGGEGELAQEVEVAVPSKAELSGGHPARFLRGIDEQVCGQFAAKGTKAHGVRGERNDLIAARGQDLVIYMEVEGDGDEVSGVRLGKRCGAAKRKRGDDESCCDRRERTGHNDLRVHRHALKNVHGDDSAPWRRWEQCTGDLLPLHYLFRRKCETSCSYAAESTKSSSVFCMGVNSGSYTPLQEQAPMGGAPRVASIWRFGAFEMEGRTAELRRNGIAVKLQDQPAQLLLFLLEHAGEIVTREDLRQKLWAADTFVDFDHALNTAIMKLREALGDTRDRPLFIQTIPRKGYRFVAPVTELPAVHVSDAEPVQVLPETELPTKAGERSDLGSDARGGGGVDGSIAALPGTGSPDGVPAAAKVETIRAGGRGWRVALVSAAVLMLAGAGALVYRGTRNPGAPVRSLTRLTFDEGLQIDPTWSPDGRYLAYSSDKGGTTNIWMQQISGGDPVEVTKGPGPNWQPNWSPDGRFIAYRSEAGGGGSSLSRRWGELDRSEGLRRSDITHAGRWTARRCSFRVDLWDGAVWALSVLWLWTEEPRARHWSNSSRFTGRMERRPRPGIRTDGG